MSRMWLLALFLALSGCSDLIPGLNVDEGGRGTHQYRVTRGEQDNAYKVEQVGPSPQYEVIPVTSDLLLTEAQQDTSTPEQIPSLLPSTIPPEYRLGPGDVFFVVVWDHPELTAPYTGLTSDLSSQGRLVASDGSAYYPYVGTFKAAGMTAADLRQYIRDHLKGVIQDPQVDVRVVAYRAGRIEVTGEVFKPGTFTFDDTPKGVLQAIDAAGGLTTLASRRRAILVRDGAIHTIDLAGLLSGNRPVPNPELRPGDVLHIPDQSNDQVVVLGAVTKQTPVTITQDPKSVVQVLAEAGGLDSLKGKDSGILVFRPQLMVDSKVGAKIYTLDLSRPEGMLLASQFKLQPRDVLYVKATKFSQYNSVINQLLPTITGAYQALLIKCFSRAGNAC